MRTLCVQMATEKQHLSKCINESEEMFDICCSPCAENGLIKEAEKYCVDCGSYICGTCLQYHRQFPILRSHKLVDNSHGGTKTVTGAQTERCSIHQGHCVDRLCKDHDEICCQACITFQHRSCKNVNSLAEVAKGIKRSKVHSDTVEGLNSTLKKVKQEKDQRSKTLSCLDKKKDTALQGIEEFQDKLVNRIKELAEVSRKEVIYKHAERVITFKSEVKELETVLSVVEDSVKKVSASGLNEEQLFVNVRSGKNIIRDVGSIFTEFSHNRTQTNLRFCCDEKLWTYGVMNMKSLGDINNIPYHATQDKSIKVNAKEINAISVFEDGTIAYVDFMNNTLTRLSDKYAVRDTISLAGCPIALCVTGPQEVAVGLREKKVQLVRCAKSLWLGNSFTTKMICTGLCYDPICDHLYVCLGAKWKGDMAACLAVYKKDGTLLKTYKNYKTGTQIFSSPNHIAIGSNSIYIADLENGVIALNKDGSRLWIFEDIKLKGAWGVCLLSDDQLLVTGYDSNNVLQVSADGMEMFELLGSSAGVNHPVSVAFDKWNSRILLGCHSSALNVYTLSR